MHIEIPMPLPDELLASSIARGAARLGLKPYLLRRQLFDYPAIRIHSLLTQDLKQIARALHDRCNWNLTAKELRDGHTLYPAAVPFISQQGFQDYAAEACFLEEHGGLLRSLRATLFLEPLHRLRGCRVCQEEDRQRYGESYWHRIHQFPGIKLCFHHSEPLHATEILASIRILPPLDNVQIGVALSLPRSVHTYQLALARDMHWLLSRSPAHFDREKLIQAPALRTALDGSTLHCSTLTSFRNLISNRISEKALESTQQGFSSFSWLSLLRSQPVHVAAPYHYSTLACAARISLEQLVESADQVSTTNVAPWPCINPHCQDFNSRVIKHGFQFGPRMHRRVGFVCPRCISRYSRPRPLVSNSDGSFEFRFETAQSQLPTVRFLEIRNFNRKKILQYRYAVQGRPANYCTICHWSEWNDADWYQLNRPLSTRGRRERPQSDSSKKDVEWLEVAKTRIPDFAKAQKEAGVRRIVLFSLINELERIRGKHLPYQKMPKTIAFLNKYTETQEAALKRRIECVLSDLRASPRYLCFEDFRLLCRWHRLSQPSGLIALVHRAYKKAPLPR